MASAYYEEVTCPLCHTEVRVRISNGLYPMRTTEIANCPVCWTELFRKNITGDIEESILSLGNTIEPYLSKYKKMKQNEASNRDN